MELISPISGGISATRLLTGEIGGSTQFDAQQVIARRILLEMQQEKENEALAVRESPPERDRPCVTFEEPEPVPMTFTEKWNAEQKNVKKAKQKARNEANRRLKQTIAERKSAAMQKQLSEDLQKIQKFEIDAAIQRLREYKTDTFYSRVYGVDVTHRKRCAKGESILLEEDPPTPRRFCPSPIRNPPL